MGSSPKVKETEESKALRDISVERWRQYQEGIPLENRMIHAMTGRALNDDGEYEITGHGRVNADGTTKINQAGSQAAVEKAFTPGMNSMDPNRTNSLDEVGHDSAVAGAEVQIEHGLGEQTNTMQGIINAAGMGQGRENENLQSSIDLAAQAEGNAARSAQRSFDNRSQNQRLVGEVAGGVYGYRNTRNKNSEPEGAS